MKQVESSSPLEVSKPLEVFLTLQGDIKICVPDSLDLITPYVLREQGDWFEDEIKFLRQILHAGDRAIDIGANYGTYTLSMAKGVGDSGQVWAFEPAKSTAECLQASITANGFQNVVLERCALSSVPGKARLSLNSNSELNALVKEAMAGKSEEVPLTTLDHCLDRFGWDEIVFMKVDAEGEEENILRGGKRFFASQSPLVEFEYKAGHEVNHGLVGAFAQMGYSSYRLVPGLNVLTPFPVGSVPDGFLLNLFCCKPDRADALHARGILIRPQDASAAELEEIPLQPCHHWKQAYQGIPWASVFLNLWDKTMESTAVHELEDSLNLYFFSRDTTQSHVLRAEALGRSLGLLKSLCELQPLYLRHSTLARVALEFGAREVAAKALNTLAGTIVRTQEINPREPFLLPLASMDGAVGLESQGDWLFSSVLEGLEVASAFSSFYTGNPRGLDWK